MAKRPVKIEVIEEGEKRFLVKVFADGSEERKPIEKLKKRDGRLSFKVAWYWDFKTGRRKFY